MILTLRFVNKVSKSCPVMFTNRMMKDEINTDTLAPAKLKERENTESQTL